MSARLTVTGTGEKLGYNYCLLSCCERSDIMNIGGRIYMSGLKIKQEWMQKTVVVWFGALLCCLLWGSAFPVSNRISAVWSWCSGYGIADPFCRLQIHAGRNSGSWDWKCNGGTFLRPERKAAKEIIWLSLLQTIIQYFFFYMGLAHTSGVKASIIEAVNVFIAILVAGFCFIRKDYIKKNHRLYSGICRSSID